MDRAGVAPAADGPRQAGAARVFFFPTGNPKPEHSGSGKPDQFDRLPVETGQIQI